jgi:hypothetical protein
MLKLMMKIKARNSQGISLEVEYCSALVVRSVIGVSCLLGVRNDE